MRKKEEKSLRSISRTRLDSDIVLALVDGRLLDKTKKEDTFSLGYEGPIPKQPYEKISSRRI